MRFTAVALGVFFTLVSPAFAQDAQGLADTGGEVDFQTYRPLANAARIDEKDAPIIDGDLSDPAWAKAEIIDSFYQVEPADGGAPSQPTQAFILFDRKILYIAFYAFDSDPDRITHNQLRRDSRLRDDDAVRILIDSFGTFRDSFFFGMNPNGARTDALTENGQRFRSEWDTVWRGKARIVSDGWIAEFAIPFQSFSFNSELEDWNLQLIRTIRRNNEELRWSNIDRSRNRIDMTNPGRLTGIKDVSSGIGLEVQAFAASAVSYDWETGQTNVEFNPSGNIFYKLTPSLTASLTANTDFSDAPLDDRQVNTGRFSLFFPETRDFFLQDISVFEFGGEVFARTVNGLPLFTRRIGIVDGAPVDIVAGAKISGRQGPFNIGAIATRTGPADAIGVDGQFLTAARLSADIFGESKAGIIFTNGAPDGGSKNTVAGADFRYKSSSLIGEGVFLADFVYLRSFKDGVGDDFFAAAFDYTGDKWGSNVVVRQIGENYSPELGFVNRSGIREYRSFIRRRFRPESGFIRSYTIGSILSAITDLDDELEDRFLEGFFEIQTNPGDQFRAEYENGFLDIREPFEIADTVPVAVGEYRYSQYELSGDLSTGRKASIGLAGRWGGVYDGDFLALSGRAGWRPSRHVSLSANYDFTKFSLPSGEIGIHVATLSSTFAFTPDFFVNTDIQYDNISEDFTLFSRLTWEPRPETEIFMSFGHAAVIERDRVPRSFRAQGSSFAIRIGNRFRF